MNAAIVFVDANTPHTLQISLLRQRRVGAITSEDRRLK